jgi:hypothetical protein
MRSAFLLGVLGVFLLLSSCGTAPDTTGDDGWPILASAVSNNRIDVAKWLLERGADVNGRSPLQIAIMEDRPEVVSLLLDPGADPNFSFEENSTPFTVACATKPGIALQMIKKGYLPESEDTARAERSIDVPRRKGGIGDQRGNFTYVLESWSPWLEHDEVDLADYPVGIYVPEHYDGTRTFGLVASMTNAKSSSRYPRHFEKTLDDHDIIGIGFDPYNGLTRIGGYANKAFCLAAVYNMLGYYNIDQSRIYIGGYSLGGQMTEVVLRTHPWIFDGAFFINISYSGGPTEDPAWYYCKHHLPVVTVEGDYDYNRTWSYKAYAQLLCSGYQNIYFFHEPMKGHKLISAESFETIVQLLEEGGLIE